MDTATLKVKEKIITNATFYDMAVGKDGYIYVTTDRGWYDILLH